VVAAAAVAVVVQVLAGGASNTAAGPSTSQALVPSAGAGVAISSRPLDRVPHAALQLAAKVEVFGRAVDGAQLELVRYVKAWLHTVTDLAE